jgi:exopolyphosphatase/guanosine-5'-triphosphate,3'-diphosphate pyrophosphatase
MRRASLDIGSQSILLLVSDQNGPELVPVREEFYAPRLGEGLAATGVLSEEAMSRAQSCIAGALEVCRESGVRQIRAAGTSAIRKAANGEMFVKRIKDYLGIEIDVLSGEEEARLSFIGAVSGLRAADGTAVLDVGGGSSECTVGSAGVVERSHSVELGALTLKERFGRSPGAIREAIAEVNRKLTPLAALAGGRILVGVGGTITTLASVYLKLERYNAERISGLTLTHHNLEELISRFCRLEVEEIERLPGMEPSRADIIEAGATIIQSFLSITGEPQIRVSDRGLRHGLLLGRSSGGNSP